MKRKSTSQSAFFNLRVLIGLFVFLSGVFLALLSFGFFSSAKAQSPKTGNANARAVAVAGALTPVVAKSFNGDVRNLRPVRAKQDERDWEERLILPPLPVGPESKTAQLPPTIPAGPMPTPIQNFEGVARLDVVTGGQAGTGFPPDTNGEVGLNHYILAVNAAYAIYDKATGTQVAAFTENSLFSGGPTGTLCDTDSFGDPVVVYDQLANRWILTNFAFVSFPGPGPFYQCFAVSQTSDPVAGGWFLYAVRIDQGAVPEGTLPDYGKFGHWNDGCLYMGANAFGAASGSIFASFSKNDMYNGLPLTGAVGIINSSSHLFPTNLLGTQPGQMPPPGTPTMREAPVRRASSLSVGVGISGAWITSEKIRESEAEVLTVSISVSQICKNAFSAPCAGERSTPLFRLGSARLSDRLRRRASFAIDEHKVDFGCLEIDARHLDRDAIGEAKALSGSLAVHRVTYRVEVKVIVAELGDVHQPVDVEAVERDEQSEMRDTAHRAGENFSDLVLHEIALEPVLDISRCIVGAALGE